jgi:hypothetical protein
MAKGLEAMNTVQRIAKNTGVIIAGEIVNKATANENF